MSMLIRPRRTHLRAWLLAAVVASVFAAGLTASSASAASKKQVKPTVVLVHGAFADASGWTGVINRLEKRGYPVIAPPNPLRGVSADSAYIKSFLSTISGPIVLVGHSYGGMVITNAAVGNPNVKALVYVAAYAPDAGDSVSSLATLGTGGQIGPATLTFRPFPLPDGTQGTEGYIKLNVFHKIFAADLPRKQARAMSLEQRPGALAALGEPSGPPAWKSIPSYYLLPTKDKAIGTDVERAMIKRMKPKKVVVAKGASHVVMISQPKKTTGLIVNAAKSIK
jgi:pimeloyl-ACP methyl ester carboxylesterase